MADNPLLQGTEIPLCVDLDGTLVQTDTLVETGGQLLKTRFFFALLSPRWLLKGRAHLKQEIAQRAPVDPRLLPYNQPLLSLLAGARSAGRRLVLCTGADQSTANGVAAHLGCVDEVMASDGVTNLSARNKRELLVRRFGEGGYDYIGNDVPDIPAFQSARKAWAVSPTRGLQRRLSSLGKVAVLVPRQPPSWRDYLSQLRFHQWLKNLLLFLPLLAAHRLSDPGALGDAVTAFIAFCICASGVYVLNDLMDLPADRRHPRKRERPLARGAISARTGLVLALVLPIVAFGIAATLPAAFVVLLAAYYFVSLNYNLWAKNIAVLDTLVLAGLYTLRIIAGAAAVSVVPSFWLLAFSMFFFLSVAMAKRYSELIALQLEAHEAVPGRQYRRIDLNTIIAQGTASGYAAVMVLALYINSDEVQLNYSRPEVIWLICPLMIYWINKVWLNTQRREMTDDPLVWALENRVSRGIAVLSAIILVAAV